MKYRCSYFPVFQVACFIVALGLLTACGSSKKIDKNYLYFQRGRDSSEVVKIQERTIKPDDQLNIQILSKTLNQEQVSVFNMSSGTGNTSASSAGAYLVGLAGNIEVPLIGSIKAEGLTKIQLQTLLATKLIPYVRDPSVIVKFLQFSVNVIGEVKGPGTKIFTTDHVTLLDAISASGDLTDLGKREDVTVIREENGKMNYTKVDLRSGAVFSSPVYRLQPNDIIYVGANNKKLIALDVNPNSGKTFSIITGVVSLSLTIFYLVFNLIRN